MLRTSSSSTVAAGNQKAVLQSDVARKESLKPANAITPTSEVVAKAAVVKRTAPKAVASRPVLAKVAVVAPKPAAKAVAAKPMVAKVAVVVPRRVVAKVTVVVPRHVVAKVAVVAPRPVVAKTMAAKPVMRKVAVVERKPAARKVAVVLPKPVRKHIVAHRSTSISVPLDEVRVVAFSQPIATVYVGNPTIADVSMIDSRHAFVLGKGFGATNIVALDADGKQVINDPISVFGHTGNIVILHRGTQQATLTCGNARCEPSPTPGDDKDSFSSRMEQLAQHQEANTKAASAGR